jgi:Papain family cysteine protease
MKCLPVIGAVLLALPGRAFAQGAILETLDDLRGVPQPAGYRGNAPDRVDLSPKLPPARAHGNTSTCVSWAATYVAASFALRARGGGAALTLSPSFTYNQVSRDQWCNSGTSISATLNFLRDTGSVPIEEFAFDGGWCGRQPTSAELERARQQLARGVPVIFATRVTRKLNALRGDTVLEEDDVQGESHAMAAVGYDDAKRAFLVQNSLGPNWGNKGLGWIGYEYWQRNVRVGFVIE